MVVERLEAPCVRGLRQMPFEKVLSLIDARRANGEHLTLVLETAAPVQHLYAVEMPAVPVLAALSGSMDPVEGAPTDGWAAEDAEAGTAVVRALRRHLPPVLWSEERTKAFIGEAGSMTCAHVDIAPQLELAHGLLGTKFVGIASHGATGRLLAEHAGDKDGDEDGEEDGEEEEGWGFRPPTSIPTAQQLTPHESSLLCDPDVSLACLHEGDLLVFSSAALHFAVNGANGVNAALYHGIVTQASLPRLEAAAAEGRDGCDGTLSAAEVLSKAREA